MIPGDLPPAPALNVLKLAPPADALRGVERSAIADTWEHARAAVTLVCAPAGFGKTTVMRQLLGAARQQGLPAAWLTVDAADNDLGRVVPYLRAALGAALPMPLDMPATDPGIDASRGMAGGSARQLLDALSRVDAPFALFVDEFEQIADPAVLSVFSELAFSLAPGQRLVFGARHKPALPLGRLRVQGRLLEIDASMLRFNAAEIRDYMVGCRGIAMADADLDALRASTEGWPAALQLAATALNGRADSRAWLRQLSGASGNLAEYLAEDVLSRLSAEHRRFVLRSSIFDAFCPQLCDAVFGEADSAEWIALSIRDNLFLLPMEADGDWYRYHPLFRQFLRAQLARTSGPEISGLHARAARWLTATARYGQAVAHAAEAGDTVLAADILEQCSMDCVRGGQMSQVAQWMEALPRTELARRPVLLTAGAYAAVFLHRYAQAEQWLAALESHGSAPHREDVAVLRVMLSAWSDGLDDAVQAAREALAGPEQSSPFVTGLLHNAVAYGDMLLGEYVAARHTLLLARCELESVGALYGLTYSACIEGMIDMLQGNVRDGVARFSAILNRTIAAGQRYTSSGPVASALLAEALYETGEIAAAEALLGEYFGLIGDTCLPDHLIVACRIASRIAALAGDFHKALGYLNGLQELGDARGIARLGVAAAIDKSRLALLAGDVANARHALAVATSRSKPFHVSPYAEDIDDIEIAGYRIALAAGDSRDATARMEAAVHHAERTGRARRAARLSWLLAQAELAAGRRQQALTWSAQALRAGQAWQAIRLFADEPWQLQPLLALVDSERSGLDPAYLERLLQAANRSSQAARPARSEQDGLLSPRELQIIRRLADGHSNKELARLLFVSENTIETHLRRINGKLGTANRMQAVAQARVLGLL
ncbi:LuxR C-terminal-related transcriptional regulator [Cupriavidus necator]|uniref:LuxR C-terminal-related transcriptional regulator n=1 Tax=Cupriavidus necator TaxID=106590 RepID=UPI0005B38D31|nr:LuxR C-terminal-related transcriptional regulator [Cupriavidus necator]